MINRYLEGETDTWKAEAIFQIGKLRHRAGKSSSRLHKTLVTEMRGVIWAPSARPGFPVTEPHWECELGHAQSNHKGCGTSDSTLRGQEQAFKGKRSGGNPSIKEKGGWPEVAS